MRLDRNMVVQALDTFTDVQPSDIEVSKLLSYVEGPKDLLCHILLNTDFLAKYPEVAATLQELSGPMSRSLLASPDAALLRARMKRSLLHDLYEKQKRWVSKTEELNQLETEILGLKNKIAAVGKNGTL
ncbi:hypothetical protein [Azospirillum sp. TSH64]|uniref:hypothetical protein n=1 Tax=Azospirillum sp. TSH64 TaxID=652740 RepID=UPI000D60C932|nr:hypothetical protein [Azospirillum sp. TSH64]PWC78159.1 hypothetical protein TSH64_28360 [Azospirillum sp. TSH64]PWC81571.1 hypothetical protein TSH64_00175 [Azospirillum sp. TSH64]